MKNNYRFYGWETADVTDERGLTPRDYYDLLSKLWRAETCAPRMRENWSPENKTLGQCSITMPYTYEQFLQVRNAQESRSSHFFGELREAQLRRSKTCRLQMSMRLLITMTQSSGLTSRESPLAYLNIHSVRGKPATGPKR